eukprot:2436869-Prymnesium_polylepis.1
MGASRGGAPSFRNVFSQWCLHTVFTEVASTSTAPREAEPPTGEGGTANGVTSTCHFAASIEDKDSERDSDRPKCKHPNRLSA